MLLTYVFLIPGDPGPSWDVADPFGLAPTPRFSRLIHDQLPHQPSLRDAVDRMLQSQHQKNTAEYLAYRERLAEEAAERLRHSLGVTLDNSSAVGEFAQLLEEKMLEIERDQGSPDLRRTAAVNAGQAVESLLAETLIRHPVQAAAEGFLKLHKTKDAIAAIGDSVGLAPMPQKIVDLSSDAVRQSLKGGHRSQRSLMVACLLACLDRPDHPLRRAAAEVPGLYVSLDFVADLRNRCAHQPPATPTNDDLAIARRAVHDAVRLLTAAPAPVA